MKISQVYLAALILITQRLALHVDLFSSRTLTAVHDKSSAWLGLGSAFMSLWQQTKLPSSTVGVLSIVIYLLGTFILHITIPGVFQVVPFNSD